MKIAAFWENPEKINQRSFANLRTQGIITVKLESFPPRFPRQTPKFNVPAEHASCAPVRPSRVSEAHGSRRALQEHLCDSTETHTHTYSALHTHTHTKTQIDALTHTHSSKSRSRKRVSRKRSIGRAMASVRFCQRPAGRGCELRSFGRCTPQTEMFQINRELPFADSR